MNLDGCDLYDELNARGPTVMAGLVPAIHARRPPDRRRKEPHRRGVDGRHKAGHDGRWLVLDQARFQDHAMRGGSVYIVTNRPNGTLYLGVTSDLARRAWQHRTGELKGFTKRYGLGRLVWYEHYTEITAAIQRERNMKHWSRAWKVRLILDMNPDWRDLYDELNA